MARVQRVQWDRRRARVPPQVVEHPGGDFRAVQRAGGACLRRGSPLASLRGSISSREAGHGEEGTVTLRLFNLVLPLLGLRLLEQGVVVGGEALTSFLASRPEQLWLSARAAALDGRALSLPLSARDYGLLPEGPVRFVVRATASQPPTDRDGNR